MPDAPPESTPPTREPRGSRTCARCHRSAWWHRLANGVGIAPVLCHDAHPSPTITPAQMANVYEALSHIERLDLPAPYEELTLFPTAELESQVRRQSGLESTS